MSDSSWQQKCLDLFHFVLCYLSITAGPCCTPPWDLQCSPQSSKNPLKDKSTNIYEELEDNKGTTGFLHFVSGSRQGMRNIIFYVLIYWWHSVFRSVNSEGIILPRVFTLFAIKLELVSLVKSLLHANSQQIKGITLPRFQISNFQYRWYTCIRVRRQKKSCYENYVSLQKTRRPAPKAVSRCLHSG